MVAALLQWFHDAFVWLGNAFLYFPHKLFDDFMIWAGNAVNSLIPGSVGNWMAMVGGAGGVVEGVGFWLGFFNVGTGISFVFCAYAWRFVVRRLPVVG